MSGSRLYPRTATTTAAATAPIDDDGDSQMQSSNSASPDTLGDDDNDDDNDDLFPDADKPSTPSHQLSSTFIHDLSPPDSHGVPLPPSMGTSSSVANANGKRPLSTLDGNGDAPSMEQHGQAGQGHQGVQTRSADATASTARPTETKTHAASGYRWSKPGDEPGWAWSNKKAVDEANRAWDGVVMKDKKIGNRYGDPFEMADKELAMIRSQAQR